MVKIIFRENERDKVRHTLHIDNPGDLIVVDTFEDIESDMGCFFFVEVHINNKIELRSHIEFGAREVVRKIGLIANELIDDKREAIELASKLKSRDNCIIKKTVVISVLDCHGANINKISKLVADKSSVLLNQVLCERTGDFVTIRFHQDVRKK